MATSHSARGNGGGTKEASPTEELLESSMQTASLFDTHTTIEPSQDQLESVGLIEALDADERPILIIDLRNRTKATPVYQNLNLQNLQVRGIGLNIGSDVSNLDSRMHSEHTAFLDWAVSNPQATNLSAAVHWGIRWTAMTLRQRWRIIAGVGGSLPSGNTSNPPEAGPHQRGRLRSEIPEESRKKSKISQVSEDSLDAKLAAFRLHREDHVSTYPSTSMREPPRSISHMRERSRSIEVLGPFDITQPNVHIPLSPHIQFFLDFDWKSTELGPIHSWSLELRRFCNILMRDPRPAAMYWGKKRTMIYNEPYVRVTGQKHPDMMGKMFSKAWAEVEQDFLPAFEKASETGVSFAADDARFYIDRHGYVEETYYSISVIPFPVEDGQFAFYNPVFETTRKVITDRRMAFLLRLGQYIASSREPKDFWQRLLHGLEADHLDLPFALLYSAESNINEDLSVSSEQGRTSQRWVLEGLVRVPEPHSEIPKQIRSEEEIEGFIPDFSKLIKADSPTLLRTAYGELPVVLKNFTAFNGDDSYEGAVFLPIRSTGDTILGFLILGINSRKRYDDDYQLFIELLSRQLATSMASAVLFEDEIRRGRIAAEQATFDRNLLSKKLAIQTHEASELETRFRRMADLAPVGMFHIDPDGVLIYANNDYYTLTEHPRDVSYPMSWYNVIHEADIGLMDLEWAKLMTGETVSFELRLKRPFMAEEIVGGEKVKGDTWIIAAAYPELSHEGTIVGILGCITDISKQKWSEGFQKRKMLEAIELKREQENFIDMTSHEMRNPLSAIVQCADWISTSLSKFDGGNRDIIIPHEVVDSYADAAQTIILCAQHQKRIIDDILTLSKLDSDLLYITPVDVQPISVIKNALRMFDAELQKSDMVLHFQIQDSYLQLGVEWVKLDPSRLLQVFINLLTNAIKFTQSEIKRNIIISLGASLSQPQSSNSLEYLPRSNNHKDETLGTHWGEGEAVYLSVEVHDSGRGLDENERTLLFKRFSQASPRTHTVYGGSGLGLFISRRLTEMQGGQIGVASQTGVGSTFAFYVRARRCEAPSNLNLSKSNLIPLGTADSISTADLDEPGALNTTDSKTTQALLSPKHVLVVEDNIINQKVLSRQLREAGCIVSVANHGEEALAFLENSRFCAGKEKTGKHLSVVLMDLEMPIMDGISCVKRIRQLQEEGIIVGHVPVIAVTANVRSERIAIAKESGMDSVVTKPFRIPELLPEIENQLKRAIEKSMEAQRSPAAL